MTLAQLQNQTGSGFDWLKYVTTIVPPDLKPPVTAQEEVVVSEPAFFNKLFDLINHNTSKRTVANYLGWRVMLSVVWDLDTRFREIYNKYRNVLYGTSVEKSRWRSCTALVGSYFDLAVGKLYVDRTFRNGSREKAEEMITDISTAFLDILLNETDWMDSEAKVFAREKALAISRKIGYPDMIYNNTAMAQHFNGTMANETEHFQNVLINSRVWAQKSVRELRDPFDKTKWATSPAEVLFFVSS
ncbi:hypothetical protein RvY_14913-2 [Ramazzottius varieornatus]|uniref:Peptidase M13 N-terminal domain-containing protein n=1 Tax=Ramazzottius varieornatus TaxID=947166 RepID=A0A1D1VUG4_RAMVA|nr:hypothetical protein RvY_14913-2 [Ramazzottius varieornatus]